jgi:hypothetical protein
MELHTSVRGIPYPAPDKYIFDGSMINGVDIHPVAAFDSDDIWYDDLISKIPEMGEKYMDLFIDCSGHAYIFLDLAQKMEV